MSCDTSARKLRLWMWPEQQRFLIENICKLDAYGKKTDLVNSCFHK